MTPGIVAARRRREPARRARSRRSHPLRNTPDRRSSSTPTRRSRSIRVLAAGLRQARLESLSITPLSSDGERLGILVCFFARRREFDDQFFDLQRALGTSGVPDSRARAAAAAARVPRAARSSSPDSRTGSCCSESLDAAIGTRTRANEPLALVFLDVDDFKSVNDRWGHARRRHGAARARRPPAARCAVRRRRRPHRRRRVRRDLRRTPTGTRRRRSRERILDVTHEPILLEGVAITVAVSAGVATYRPDTDPRPTGDQLLIRADGAMYSSKGAGKDRVTLEPRPVG